jgi:hypothetical protein
MMMVMTMMAEGLHLFSRYGQTPDGVKWFVAFCSGDSKQRHQDAWPHVLAYLDKCLESDD